MPGSNAVTKDQFNEFKENTEHALGRIEANQKLQMTDGITDGQNHKGF